MSSFICDALEISARVQTSSVGRLGRYGAHATKSDAVLVSMEAGVSFTAGQVWFFVDIGGGLIALFIKWELQSYDSEQGVAVWLIVDDPILVELEPVLASILWCEKPVGLARTIVPFQFRGLAAVDG